MNFSAFERYRALMELSSSAVTAEEESSDYQSGLVEIGSATWRIRTGRITPTKPGAFVAVWRRAPDGGTEPFDGSDGCVGLLVFVEDGPRFGVFSFTREHLEELGILRSSRSAGKRGFRVYPSWCSGLNPQATRTQVAQGRAFTEL